VNQRIFPDTELIEFICEDRDANHYVGDKQTTRQVESLGRFLRLRTLGLTTFNQYVPGNLLDLHSL
jgi:hypothetical protein